MAAAPERDVPGGGDSVSAPVPVPLHAASAKKLETYYRGGWEREFALLAASALEAGWTYADVALSAGGGCTEGAVREILGRNPVDPADTYFVDSKPAGVVARAAESAARAAAERGESYSAESLRVAVSGSKRARKRMREDSLRLPLPDDTVREAAVVSGTGRSAEEALSPGEMDELIALRRAVLSRHYLGVNHTEYRSASDALYAAVWKHYSERRVSIASMARAIGVSKSSVDFALRRRGYRPRYSCEETAASRAAAADAAAAASGVDADGLPRVPHAPGPPAAGAAAKRAKRLANGAARENGSPEPYPAGGKRDARRQTHCKNGHELVSENLYNTADGRRRCKHCGRARQSKSRSKLRRSAVTGSSSGER